MGSSFGSSSSPPEAAAATRSEITLSSSSQHLAKAAVVSAPGLDTVAEALAFLPPGVLTPYGVEHLFGVGEGTGPLGLPELTTPVPLDHASSASAPPRTDAAMA
jgi:hypothetical protein